MGNSNSGEEDNVVQAHSSRRDSQRNNARPDRNNNVFFCGSNRQNRVVEGQRPKKQKRSRKNQQMLADYDQMLDSGMQRQQKINVDSNNNIRDTYMNKLGVQNTQPGSLLATPGSNSIISHSSASTSNLLNSHYKKSEDFFMKRQSQEMVSLIETTQEDSVNVTDSEMLPQGRGGLLTESKYGSGLFQQQTRIQTDAKSPIRRTTVTFGTQNSSNLPSFGNQNLGDSLADQPKLQQETNLSRRTDGLQSNNLEGYYTHQQQQLLNQKKRQDYRRQQEEQLRTETTLKESKEKVQQPASYIEVEERSSGASGSVEEAKDGGPLLATPQSVDETNDELFRHLSYLSQLNKDVMPIQHVEQSGPGEYRIKLIDTMAASPSSSQALTSQAKDVVAHSARQNKFYDTPQSKREARSLASGGITRFQSFKNNDCSSREEIMNQGVPKSWKKQTSRIGKHLERTSTFTTDGPQVDLEANLAKIDSHEYSEQDHTNGKACSLYSKSRLDFREMTTVGAQSTTRDSYPQSLEQDILNAKKDRANLRSSSRSSNQIRTGLLSRLTYDKIWLKPADRPKTSQTCIIFDWDDTILCTTFLAPHQQLIYEPNLKFPPSLQRKLSELDDVAYELLSKSKTFGRVYIVTNAAEGWVQLSANRFLPRVYKEISSDVTIISARARYERMYPRNYQKWKVQAFLETRADMEDDAITNLIALGDNIFEIEAAYILGNQFKSAFIKTVKFRQSPSTSELIKQIRLVLTQFELICNSPKNLTVRLLKQNKEEEQVQRPQASNGLAKCDQATLASTNMMKNYNERKA